MSKKKKNAKKYSTTFMEAWDNGKGLSNYVAQMKKDFPELTKNIYKELEKINP